jgi:cytochrome oxidase Cu insertion factor (SCO1/SenC/PrrC family)
MTRSRLRLVALLLALAAAGGSSLALVARVAFGETQRASPALPAFHGQASWAAGQRAAPPFRLRDHSGAPISLAALRGPPCCRHLP